MKIFLRNSLSKLAFALVLCAASAASCTLSSAAQNASWQRVTAHINGVFSPRGYFNLLVGLYSLPTLKSAQFNLSSSSIVLDFPPNTPTITADQIQHIEKLAGYRAGPIIIRRIAVQDFAETGPGWIKIKHPKSRNTVARWFQQNF